jgi:hypothetical protein
VSVELDVDVTLDPLVTLDLLADLELEQLGRGVRGLSALAQPEGNDCRFVDLG